MGRTKPPPPLTASPPPPPPSSVEPVKRKKKGRPSLLDIQKRLLKQQRSQSSYPTDQKNPNPSNPIPPANQPNSQPGPPYRSSQWASDDDGDERLPKKHRFLQGLEGEDPNIDAHQVEKVSKGTDERYGSLVELGPTTPLPDKLLLVFILDRLQKKDTYGVFSEPVDPEELPDYHDIIKHPMDFGTVRKKLDDGEYPNLEKFEKDIFLICSNAMEYNAPDTVFFKQARAMQELARKDFENLRQDSDSDEPQQPKVVRRGRPPGSGQKKSLEKSPLERIGNEGSSDATLANEDNSPWSNTYNLRREPPVKNFGPFESNGLVSHRTPNSESHSSWFTEMENEFPGSVWRNVTKNGKRLTYAEEHRRETYNQAPPPLNDGSPLAVFDKENKQLVMVGLQFEHAYARSLARFAANLGPVAWKIASRKIESVLPPGVKFGPGWVGENDNMKPPEVNNQKCSVGSFPSEGPSSGQFADNMQRLKFGSNIMSTGDPRGVDSSLSQIPQKGSMNCSLGGNPAVPNGFIPTYAHTSTSSEPPSSSSLSRSHVPPDGMGWNRQGPPQVEEHRRSSTPTTHGSNNTTTTPARHSVPGSSYPNNNGEGPSQQPDLALQL
ncbi:hypothetical protein MLD38_022158 [Melastoma candidum]|uniref:Uncharacterized protein n=1 Tax=Melastoma candidum TaxID=119954 RepID=A0ACB9QRH5_9MYRT|nr:hypothetical protein MLD38_022158 [Melastoma candidum]